MHRWNCAAAGTTGLTHRADTPWRSCMRIEDALPRLTAAYHRGLLVPFLGAGMSASVYPEWKGFVKALEKIAGSLVDANSKDRDKHDLPDALIRRANSAIR